MHAAERSVKSRVGQIAQRSCDGRDIEPESGRKGIAKWAANAELAERLWVLSEPWTGLKVA